MNKKHNQFSNKFFKNKTQKNLRINPEDTISTLGKVLPQALEIESAVLGAIMIDKYAINQIGELLKPEHFYKPEHQEIYKAILVLYEKEEPIDILTISDTLKKKGVLDGIGGNHYIASLTQKITNGANIEKHARIILEQSIKRELISISSEITEKSFEDITDAFDLLDELSNYVFELSETNIKKSFDKVDNLLTKAIAELEIKRKNELGDLTGVPSGFTNLDRVTGGWQKSDLIILAARPGVGKTAFIISALRNAAIDHNKSVAFFTLEMSSLQVINRLISLEAEINSKKLKTGNLEDYEWEKLIEKTTNLGKSSIYIDDTPAISVLELRVKARRLKQKHKIDILAVDYLQLMTGDTSNKQGMRGNREQDVAYISRSLKGLAKELDIPIIALAQLSRAVETRGGDKKPVLSDLRESGSMEQDADIVSFLYRPEYHGFLTDKETGESYKGMTELIIAKHRNGSLEDVKLNFIGEFTKFVDYDDNQFRIPTMERKVIPSSINASVPMMEIDEDPLIGREDEALDDFETERNDKADF